MTESDRSHRTAANGPSIPPVAPARALPVALPIASSNDQPQPPSQTGSARSPAGNTPRGQSAWRADERTGSRALEEVRERLSARDWTVLRSVQAHRFLSTRQIEQLHFAAHATPLSAARSTRRVLARLDRLRMLRHLDRRVGGVRAGSASYVWAVGPVGDRLLRVDSGTRQRSREPSERFMGHALAVADVHVALTQAERTGRIAELVDVQTEPTCWRHYLGPSGEQLVLASDLFVVTATSAFEQLYFIEVDQGHEHLPTILRKCRDYQAYGDTGAEQRTSGTFPLVIWVLSSPERVSTLGARIAAAPSIDASLFRITTQADLIDTLTEDQT